MKHEQIKRLVLTALFMALTCVATMAIQISIPATGGYVNIGDCFVLLSAVVLGPVYGAVAGGVGPALADIITGHAVYAPATLIIKALMAVITGLIFRAMKKHVNTYVSQLVGSVAAELWMILGYFIFEWLFLADGGLVAAAAAIPGNLIQGAVGIVAALALNAALSGTKTLNGVKENG